MGGGQDAQRGDEADGDAGADECELVHVLLAFLRSGPRRDAGLDARPVLTQFEVKLAILAHFGHDAHRLTRQDLVARLDHDPLEPREHQIVANGDFQDQDLAVLMVRTGEKHLAIGRCDHLRPGRGGESHARSLGRTVRPQHCSHDGLEQRAAAARAARVLGGYNHDSLLRRLGAQGRDLDQQHLQIGGLARDRL